MKQSLDKIKDTVLLQLYKIPEDHELEAGKGYHGILCDLPRVVVTPRMCRNLKTHRVSTMMIIEDVSSVNKEEIMRGKIPYRLIAFLPYGHALAHGEADLNQPLRYPSRFSIVGSNYWDNGKDYDRLN